ncbi:hypothetical protein GCM10018954_098110 [Kutzneria kofuensis]
MTEGKPRSAREAVAVETCARRATSRIVGIATSRNTDATDSDVDDAENSAQRGADCVECGRRLRWKQVRTMRNRGHVKRADRAGRILRSPTSRSARHWYSRAEKAAV